MKLIVVGNGLFTELQGHLIDRFDTVVRLSSAKVKGWEPLVGSKKDILSVARIENHEGYDKIWLGNPMGLSSTPQRAVNEAYPNGLIMNESLDRCYQQGEFNINEHPTLGLITIFMALEYGAPFFKTPITITGFDFTHEGCSTYYWDNTPSKKYEPSLEYGHHNPNKERKVLKQLINDGKVKLLNPRSIYLLEDYLDPTFIDFHIG